MVRKAAVAGRFYPGSAAALLDTVDGLFLGIEGDVAQVRTAVLPHAGYIFSGRTAAAALARVDVPRRVLIAGPNHTGRGSAMALFPNGSWEIPGGAIPVDSEFSERLLKGTPLESDTRAHASEHSIEVQLPLLRKRCASMRIAPVCLGALAFEDCERLGVAIAEVVRQFECDGEEVLLVASTDMSHFLPADEARRLDQLALDQLLRLDPKGLLATVRREHISMCGVVPTVTLLVASLALGASRARLVDYTNSGERSGDFREVVGYASALIS